MTEAEEYGTGFYIYQHLNKEGEVIYVGRTTDMKNRQLDHKRNSNHRKEIYKIMFSDVENRTLMVIYELYYINKLNPKYNIADNRNDDMQALGNIRELVFQKYTQKRKIKTLSKESKNYREILKVLPEYKEVYTDLIYLPRDTFTKEIPIKAQQLWVEIVKACVTYGYFYMKNKTIAELLGVGESSTQRHIKVLKDNNYIEIEHVINEGGLKRLLYVKGYEKIMVDVRKIINIIK